MFASGRPQFRRESPLQTRWSQRRGCSPTPKSFRRDFHTWASGSGFRDLRIQVPMSGGLESRGAPAPERRLEDWARAGEGVGSDVVEVVGTWGLLGGCGELLGHLVGPRVSGLDRIEPRCASAGTDANLD